MRIFDYEKLNSLQFDSTIINLLTSIHEAKGRQELYLAKQPEELNRLVEIAKVQSIDASNSIEVNTQSLINFYDRRYDLSQDQDAEQDQDADQGQEAEEDQGEELE